MRLGPPEKGLLRWVCPCGERNFTWVDLPLWPSIGDVIKLPCAHCESDLPYTMTTSGLKYEEPEEEI